MAVTSCERDGKVYWQVYVNVRSKTNPSLRKRKRIFDLPSEKVALAEEKKLLRELTAELAQQEGIGLAWEQVVDR